MLDPNIAPFSKYRPMRREAPFTLLDNGLLYYRALIGSDDTIARALQPRAATAHRNSVLPPRTAIVHCHRALKARTATAHCNRAMQSRTATVHCNRAVQSRVANMHCNRALQPRTAIEHCFSPTASSHVHCATFTTRQTTTILDSVSHTTSFANDASGKACTMQSRSISMIATPFVDPRPRSSAS